MKVGRLYARYKEIIDDGCSIILVCLMYLQIVAVGYALYSYYSAQRTTTQLWTWWKCLAAFSTMTSFSLWAYARLSLGHSFSLVAITADSEHDCLVTEGLYYRFTSPMYLFSSMTFASFVILIEKFDWLFLLVLLVPLQIYRARAESAALSARYGEAYQLYLNNVWI